MKKTQTRISKIQASIKSLPKDVRLKYEAKYEGNSAAPKSFAKRGVSMSFAKSENIEGAEHSLTKYYTFDERGHIMVATTSADTENLAAEVRSTFKKVIVFFGAWTAALARKGHTIMDYEAVNQIIASSGNFVSTNKEKRTYHSDSTSVSLNTSIIGDILGTDITGGGMAIAKKTLAIIGGEIKSSFEKQQTDKEIAHLLFICESLMGMPIVTVSLFHTKVSQHEWVQKTDCEKVSRQTVDFEFESDDYMFVDPDYINQFTDDFEKSADYEKLIENLAASLDKPQKDEQQKEEK